MEESKMIKIDKSKIKYKYGKPYFRKDNWIDEVVYISHKGDYHAIYFWNGRNNKNCRLKNLTYRQLKNWVWTFHILQDNRYAIQIIY